MRKYFKIILFIFFFCQIFFWANQKNLLSKGKDQPAVDSEMVIYHQHSFLVQFKRHPHFEDEEINPLFTGYRCLDSLNSIFKIDRIQSLLNPQSIKSDSKLSLLENIYLFSSISTVDIYRAIDSYQSLDLVQLAEANYYYYIKTNPRIPISSKDKIRLRQTQETTAANKAVTIGIIGSSCAWDAKWNNFDRWQNPAEEINGRDSKQNRFYSAINRKGDFVRGRK
ncbi:hypothetical protein B6I21_06000 [candidate division KSB1 bacterium 4572_119]|nr:MAG: hypothetical protein B6I21_06000 [candidate division KSB1 bacterium 4572_119]